MKINLKKNMYSNFFFMTYVNWATISIENLPVTGKVALHILNFKYIYIEFVLKL